MQLWAPMGSRHGIVRKDCKKVANNELKLIKGNCVINIDKICNDRCWGTNSKGKSGLFPPSSLRRFKPPFALVLYNCEKDGDGELVPNEEKFVTNIEF
jgi:hypothetical protein